MKAIKFLAFLFVMLAIAVAGYGYYFSITPLDAQAKKVKVEVEVARGITPKEISKSLESEGVIRSAELFLWYGRLTGAWSKIKAAEYVLSPSLSPREIFKILISGLGLKRQFLIREGENIYQIAAEFEQLKITTKTEALDLMRSKDLLQKFGLWSLGIRSFEGYLQPNTYFYEKHDSAETLVKRMADAFFKSWTPELENRAKEMGFSRHQVVTMASVIEKETGAASERPIIGSVFHNRLKKKMRLQSDPTTIYGFWEQYNGNITRSMLHTPSPYNTYTQAGLPVGPISNPHIESIKAALYPATSEYLFFVSKNDGTHQFSKTYEEHNSWVRKLQLDPSARAGKSWRDLNKPAENTAQ